MSDKKTLGEAIFVDIESNAYLNELHENILFNYALRLFQIQGGQREYNLKDALRFADLLSKSTHPTNSDSHKMWAQELIVLLNELHPDDALVKLYAGSVFSSAGNHQGLQIINSEYQDINVFEKIFEQFRNDYLTIPAAPEMKFFSAQKEAYDHLTDTELANVVNRYIDHDGYKLVVSDTIGDKNFYKCISTRIGVQGEVKNIIFAAKYKPEIAFDDALNNDIRITKNENQCLIYNRPIPSTGVMWNDLVDWYAEEKNIDENREIVFIKRLCECLDTSFKTQGAKSGPETWMLQAYYNLKKELGKDLPALIPQVYLYYDPQTLKQRGYKLFEHQKMDFLMIFSHKDRVVIEIDGRQHYAEGNSASPRLYSEMVRAQREMTLFGYDVYRFGGYEFVGADSDEKKKEAVLDDLKQFFLRLFSKYSAL